MEKELAVLKSYEEFLHMDNDIDIQKSSLSYNDIKELTIMDREIKIEDPHEEVIDYNFCCYCTEEFATEGIRDRHEVQCHMGPQLVVRLSAAKFQDAAIVDDSEAEQSGGTAGHYTKQNFHKRGDRNMTDLQHSIKPNAPTRSKRHQNVDLKEETKLDDKISSCEYNYEKLPCQEKSGSNRKNKLAGNNYQCSTCDYKTRHKCNLIRHLLIHRPPTNNTVNNKTANNNNYTCEHCGYETTVVARFQRHILKHGKYNLKCDECDYETYRIDALKKHMLIHTKFFKCDQCGYTAKRKNSLKRHLLSHNNVHKEETKHKCYICDYSSKYKSGLEKHLWTHGIYDKTKNIYKCEQCNYTSFFKENLPRHMLSHNSAKKEKKFECEHCDYKTHRKDCLRLHSHIHQEDKMKNCSICNGRYTSYQLKRHMLSHGALSGKNSNIVYKCEQCDYKSFRKDQLKTHLQSHDALGVNKKYVCDKCDYKTYSNAKLKRHMLVHAKTRENKNFKCKQCDYETYRKDYLTNHHRLKHKAGVEHKCSVCNYSSKWISYVERHMLKHGIVSEKMKKNSFECEDCGYKSYVKQNFKGHMRKHDKTKCI